MLDNRTFMKYECYSIMINGVFLLRFTFITLIKTDKLQKNIDFILKKHISKVKNLIQLVLCVCVRFCIWRKKWCISVSSLSTFKTITHSFAKKIDVRIWLHYLLGFITFFSFWPFILFAKNGFLLIKQLI